MGFLAAKTKEEERGINFTTLQRKDSVGQFPLEENPVYLTFVFFSFLFFFFFPGLLYSPQQRQILNPLSEVKD